MCPSVSRDGAGLVDDVVAVVQAKEDHVGGGLAKQEGGRGLLTVRPPFV